MKELAVRAVTEDGCPLSIFESSAVGEMVVPITRQLNMSLKQKVRDLVLEATSQRVPNIKAKVSKRQAGTS